jgi:hypothetical protein
MQLSKTLQRNDKKIFTILTIMMFVIFLFTADGHRHSPDEEFGHQQAKRIFDQKPHPDYIQDQSHYGFDYPTLKQPWMQPICYNGILCSAIPIGYAVTIVPFIALNDFFNFISSETVTWTVDDFPKHHYILWRNSLEPNFVFTEIVYGPFFASLTVGVFYFFCRIINYQQTTSVFLALLLGLSTILWAYSQTSLNVVPATLFNFLAFFFFIKYTKDHHSRNLLFCGICLGTAYLVRMDAILLIFSIMPFLIYNMKNNSSKLKSILAYLIPITCSFFIQKTIDSVRFGSSYVSEGMNAIATSANTSQIPNLLGHNYPLFIGGFGLLLSPGIGLLIFSPLLFLIFLSFPDFYKNHKQECILIITLVSLFLIFFGTTLRWHGLIGWSARYLLVIVPFLLLPLGATIEKRNSKFILSIIICLGAIGAFFNLTYLYQDVIFFVWGEPGLNGLYAVDKIDNVRNDLNLDPSTMWSFKYSQLTHSILSVFNGAASIDIFLMKVLGETIYYISLVSILSFLSSILILIFKRTKNFNAGQNILH